MSDALNQESAAANWRRGAVVSCTDSSSKSKTEIAICGWQPPQAMGFQGGSI